MGNDHDSFANSVHHTLFKTSSSDLLILFTHKCAVRTRNRRERRLTVVCEARPTHLTPGVVTLLRFPPRDERDEMCDRTQAFASTEKASAIISQGAITKASCRLPNGVPVGEDDRLAFAYSPGQRVGRVASTHTASCNASAPAKENVGGGEKGSDGTGFSRRH